MEATLNQPCRVQERALRVLNCFGQGAIRSTGGPTRVPGEQASANSVPAAAVIRGMRALSGFIGFKGCVGGSLGLKGA